MDFLLDLIVTLALIAIVVWFAIKIYAWMAPGETWAMPIRIVMGLIALVVLVGFLTRKIPLVHIPL